MVKKTLILLFVLLNFVNAQNIEVTAYTDSSQYFVGDYIKYTIDVKYDKSIKVEFPNLKDSLKQLEFINELPKFQNEVDDKIVESRSFNLSYYDSASVTIPSLPIKYSVNGSQSFIMTNPINVVIKAIPTNPQKDIKDIKSPVRIPFDWILLLLIFLGIALLALAAYWIYNKYFKKSEELPVKKKIIIPAHEAALKELRRIEEEKLWQQGKIKEFHTQITNVVRTYFEKRFSILALEMPSSELITELNKIQECDSIIDTSIEFFENADLVKFAKFQPMPSVNENMIKQAFDIVLKTKQKLELENTGAVNKEHSND